MTRQVRRARLFLDANVLVSAAWKNDSRLLRLWQIPAIELVTSNLVIEECHRNLPLPEQQKRLAQLLDTVRILVLRQLPVSRTRRHLPQKTSMFWLPRFWLARSFWSPAI